MAPGDAQALLMEREGLRRPVRRRRAGALLSQGRLWKKEIQDKFKAKYNYDLPAPPKTTKEYHDVADFFTGWDWNGDGQNDWGISLHAKVNEQGFFHFLTLSAPFVVSPDNKYYFFNPDTMKPLINSEGHVQGAGGLCEVPRQRTEGGDRLDAWPGLEPVPRRPFGD